MRVLLITQDFPPGQGGIQTWSIERATALSKRCDWIGVVAPGNATSMADRSLPFPVMRFRCREDLLLFRLAPELPLLLQRYRVDLVLHAQWQTAGASLLARRLGWGGSIVAAAHIRELLFNPWERAARLSALYGRFRRTVFAGIDRFYPVSRFTATELERQGVDPSDIRVVINGTDPARFRPDPSLSLRNELGLAGRKVILTVCRLVERKGVDLSIRALERVLKNCPEAHLLIVGDGEERVRLAQLASETGVRSRVTFAGSVPHSDLPRYYNSADLFVLPARSRPPDLEGFGIVFLEAGASGLPVVGSRTGGIPSAVIDGETGILIPEEAPDALAESILRLFDNPGLARTLGERARTRVVREANWERTGSEMYEDLRARFFAGVR